MLEIGGQDRTDPGTVPAPVPPDDPEAWYAADVRAQYEPIPGVVATVTETATGFAYDTREPPLDAGDEAALASVREHFSAVRHRRPLTRQGVVERATAGFEPKYERALDRLLDTSAAARRRIDYHALSELRLLGEVTPLAVDDRIEVADVGDEEELVVHTDAFAPVRTGVDAGTEYVERVAGDLSDLETARLSDGVAVEIAYRRSVADTVAENSCPGGPNREFGDCKAIDGVVVQERAGETVVVAVAFDVHVSRTDGVTELTMVVDVDG